MQNRFAFFPGNLNHGFLTFIDELMGRLPRNRPANTRVILQRLDEIERQLKLFFRFSQVITREEKYKKLYQSQLLNYDELSNIEDLMA